MARKNLLVISILLLAILACNAAAFSQTIPTVAPTIQPVSTLPQQAGLPLTEANVPRVTAKEARLAFDNDKAIIVDVRSADVYAISHIAGSISIPLVNIENNPAGLSLDKNQWIITYCT